MNLACPPTPCSAATSLSGPKPRLARRSSRRNSWSSLAQSSLYLVLLTTTSTGCLVTSTPDFTPPKRTRPFLITATADPDPRNFQILDGPPGSAFAPTFSAGVLVGDQDDKIKARLYIDYGNPNLSGDPFKQYYPVQHIDASTVADTKTLRIKANTTLAYPILPGWHTATLMVSHEFADNQCPVCLNDSSQISWPLYRCNSLDSADSCKPNFSLAEMWAPGCSAVADPDAGVDCGAIP